MQAPWATGSAQVIPRFRADLSTLDGCRSIVADAFAAFENVDVWVNNAGADVLTGEAADWPQEHKLKRWSSSI